MTPFDFPSTHSNWFWLIAFVVTAYHATRAVFHQIRWREDENTGRAARNLKPWSLAEQVFIHRIHDALFHVVCSMGGFLAVHTFARVFNAIGSLSEIGAGTAILMSFLALVGLAGVAGVLPQILLYGKLLNRG